MSENDVPEKGIALNGSEQDALIRLWETAQEGDHYAMLGVRDDAERADIQRAYHTLSRQWHPDRFFRKELGTFREKLDAVFIAITDAYRTLSNDTARRAYDIERESDPRRRSRRRSRSSSSASSAPSEAAEALAREDAERARSRRSSLAEGRAAGRARRTTRLEDGASAPRPEAPAADAARPATLNKAMAEMRMKMRGQLRRARELYEEGKAQLEAGNPLRASTALTMATSFDPRNEEYKALAAQAQRAARKIQAKNFVQLAESAEGFANLREAIANYQKAVEYEVDDARPYYRLGMLIRKVDDNSRGALDLFRIAVTKDPQNIEYRMALGELYAEFGLKVNAQGQFKRILEIDRTHDRAKAALRAL